MESLAETGRWGGGVPETHSYAESDGGNDRK